MTSISATSSNAMASVHHAAARPVPVKMNDGDADDTPKAAAPASLARSGPGQMFNKVA